MSRARTWAVALMAIGLFSIGSAPLDAQDTSSLAGVIVSNSTGGPVPGATVSLIGVGMETDTDENGEFLLEGVPAGALKVRFEAPEYVSVVEELEASVGTFLRVRMSRVDAVLDEILVIAGREPTRDGLRTLTVTKDEEGWRSVLDLLDDQVPGVFVRRGGGNLGSGAFVYIRSAGTFQGDSAPDVYLDGIRIDGRNTGTRSLHVLDLISAHDVARVRVHKGASGGAGFALGGANGVIEIETNQGRASASGN